MPVDWRAQGNLTNPGLCETEKQETRACSEPRLRGLSDVLLQQVARPCQTTVRKSSKVGSQRRSQWHPVSRQREKVLQCIRPNSLGEERTQQASESKELPKPLWKSTLKPTLNHALPKLVRSNSRNETSWQLHAWSCGWLHLHLRKPLYHH